MDTEQIMNDVKKTFDSLLHYSEEAQLELFLSGYDNSSAFMHFSSDGRMRNYGEFKTICGEYYDALSSQKILTIHERIHVIDTNLAVLGWTGNIVAQFKNGDVMKMENYAITSVFKKINDDWKIIHAHESAVPPEIIKKQ